MGRSAEQEKQAGYKEVGRIGVLVHPEGEMTNSDWGEIQHQLKSHAPALRIMVVWAEGTLTPKQRAEVQALQKANTITTVMFTDSALTRGVMRVLQWFGIPVMVHAKSQLTAGLAEIGATPEEILNVRMAIRELERKLGLRVSSSGHISVKPPDVKTG